MVFAALHALLPFFVLAKANSVKEMRHAIGGEDHNELVEELKLSLSPTIQMLNSQMTRLRLKNKPFKTFGPAAGEELDDMWSHCLNIDANLTVNRLFGNVYTKPLQNT